MDDRLIVLRAYQREVLKQCRFAMHSTVLLDEANSVRGPQSQTLAWYAIQGFLVAAGNISKLLWGSKVGAAKDKLKKRESERRRLRSSLEVTENSILKLSPEFRNHWEHFDERIEDWAEETVAYNIVDDCIGPPNMINGIDNRDRLREYDPGTHTLRFRGESFDIMTLVRAIEALLPVVEAEALKPHWETPSRSQPSNSSGSGQ